MAEHKTWVDWVQAFEEAMGDFEKAKTHEEREAAFAAGWNALTMLQDKIRQMRAGWPKAK